MSSTTRTTREQLAETNETIAALAKQVAVLTALLNPTETAKTVTKSHYGNTVSKRDARGRYLPAKGKTTKAKRTTRKAKATKVLSGDTKWDGSRKDRSRWNDALSASSRLAGKVAKGKNKGKSYYSLVISEWDEVAACRKAGMTPNQVLAVFVTA